jgi:hypothetical protein
MVADADVGRDSSAGTDMGRDSGAGADTRGAMGAEQLLGCSDP